MATNLPKSKPARTGGLAGYPKASGNGFKVGNIGFFDRAPDARWLPCDGSYVSPTAYPELARLLAPIRLPLLQQLATPSPNYGTAQAAPYALSMTADNVYLAIAKDATSTNVTITLYKNTNDVISGVQSLLANSSSNAISGMAWSPDGTKLAVLHSGLASVQMYTRTGDTLAYTSVVSAGVQFQNQITWIDNDLFATYQGNANPYISLFTVTGAGVATAVTGPTVATPVTNLYVTPGKLLVAVGASGAYIYQRSGNALSLLGSFTPASGVTLAAYSNVAVFGEADVICLLHTTFSTPSLAVYTKSANTWTYTTTGKVPISIGGTTFDIIADSNKEYLYVLNASNTSTNALSAIYSMTGGNIVQIASDGDFVFTGTTAITNIKGNYSTPSGKYIISITSVAPYFAVFKELNVNPRLVLPTVLPRLKLGRKVYPFIKAKS